MEILETINKYPLPFAGGVLAFGVLVFSLAMRSAPMKAHHPVFPEQSFFTTDDGATWFADSATNIPPFDHDGNQAVQAMLFSCDGGRHKWVQYLQKYSDEAKASALQIAAGESLPPGAAAPLAGMMVKAPGAAQWVSQSSPQARGIMTPTCPAGSLEPAMVVVP